ncbi:MAG: hypothetical protein QXJ64_08800 [Thermosphaera sp.]
MPDLSDNNAIDGSVVFDDSNIKCTKIYGLLICKGDYVRVYPRSRGLAYIDGIVSSITSTAIILENEDNAISIRFAEIKMIQKPKVSTR